MADCASHHQHRLADAVTTSRMELGEAARPGRHLRAVCVCGATDVMQADHWIATGLATLRLDHFEGRMRCCCCGARRARFEVWVGEPPKPNRTAIYAFL